VGDDGEVAKETYVHGAGIGGFGCALGIFRDSSTCRFRRKAAAVSGRDDSKAM
jgi:hypothetical protein